MTRVETLREQASVLRTLADSFDDEAIRSELLRVAERCQELADRIAATIRSQGSRPIGDLGTAASQLRPTPTAGTSTE